MEHKFSAVIPAFGTTVNPQADNVTKIESVRGNVCILDQIDGAVADVVKLQLTLPLEAAVALAPDTEGGGCANRSNRRMSAIRAEFVFPGYHVGLGFCAVPSVPWAWAAAASETQ